MLYYIPGKYFTSYFGTANINHPQLLQVVWRGRKMNGVWHGGDWSSQLSDLNRQNYDSGYSYKCYCVLDRGRAFGLQNLCFV